jgi:hypothetical protein
LGSTKLARRDAGVEREQLERGRFEMGGAAGGAPGTRFRGLLS